MEYTKNLKKNSKTIAIDARFYGTENTGLGRYTQNILNNFFSPQDPNHYLVFVNPKYQNLKFPGNVTLISVRVKHYTILEQLVLPFLLIKHRVDLLYTLHFNAPIFSPVPLVVTVHDLIKTHFVDITTSTHGKILFFIKRLGYSLVMKQVLSKARSIIVPSLAVKTDINNSYPTINPQKIYIIKEAVDPQLTKIQKKTTSSKKSRKSYNLLYVGNAYPHKNLPCLLSAFSILRRSGNYYLTLITQKSLFLESCLTPLSSEVRKYIIIKTNVTDSELERYYHTSDLLVTPSFMEGFGLPPLEALTVGTPVVASNIPVYREIFGDHVSYFDPTNSQDCANVIKKALRTKLNKPFTYSRNWQDVVKEVKAILI
mgnify:CR=1 FL=1